MCCKVSKGAIAYDTPFARSKVPFARTIATFRGRSFKPSVVVLYKNAFMGFSGDAYINTHEFVNLHISRYDDTYVIPLQLDKLESAEQTAHARTC